MPWARAVDGLRFTPHRWGPGAFRIAAPGGAHLLIRRHGAPELTLWLPARLAPTTAEPFGLYIHLDRGYPARLRAASKLRRALEAGMPGRPGFRPDAERLAAMLYVHDLTCEGASLREIADRLLSPAPADWRASSERSDLRRLADAADMMVDRGYRSLLDPRSEHRRSATR